MKWDRRVLKAIVVRKWCEPIHVMRLMERNTERDERNRPATGDAFTHPYSRRTSANWIDFLERVEKWLPAEADQIYAIVDNVSSHRTTDVLLFSLAHPRWEFVFQPKYAAYLNLIEPWWKILRSLALKGRRFETWDEVCAAVTQATAYWNKHKHPFHWGRRRRHRPRRPSGIALTPSV
jgi:transposase